VPFFVVALSGSVILGDGLWHTITALDALIRGDAVVALRNLYPNAGPGSSGAAAQHQYPPPPGPPHAAGPREGGRRAPAPLEPTP
jgi:hypothetical protein